MKDINMKKINIKDILYSELYASDDLKKCKEFHIKKGQKYIKETFHQDFQILEWYEHFFIEQSLFLLLGSYISRSNGIILVFFRTYYNDKDNCIHDIFSCNFHFLMHTTKSISNFTIPSSTRHFYFPHSKLISFHMNSLKKKKTN